MSSSDDLILTAETREEAWEMFNTWKDAMELRGLRINLSKTKLLVTGKSGRPIESGNYPCGVCGRGVGRNPINSIKCTTCEKWCHKPCSGLASLNVQNFSCPTCVAGPSVVADDSIAIADGTILEVEQFCYLGDMLDRSGDAERAVRCRIACGWAKWRELAALLGNRGIPLKHRGKVYEACVRSVITYGSETWPLTKKLEDLLVKSDRRMLRYMAGVSLRDRVTNEDLLRRCGLGCISAILYRKRLGWFGHVCRRDINEPIGRVRTLEAPGRAPQGRPKMAWRGCVDRALQATGLTEADALDRDEWRRSVRRLTSSTEGTSRR